MSYSLCDFIETLYQAQTFEEAFTTFQNEIFKLGYDGILYTCIPQLIVSSNFGLRPIYKLSEGYCPAYIQHYTDAHFEKNDPLIRAVSAGISSPIDWSGEICKKFSSESKASKEVIEVAGSYGIRDGVTIPLFMSGGGIAGASFIIQEDTDFQKLCAETNHLLKLRTHIFHNFITSNSMHLNNFFKPIVDEFSNTQRRCLAGLAMGKSTSQIAAEIGTSTGYLEQAMFKLRRKVSEDGDTKSPIVSRNQLLYHAGLMNILEYEIEDE